MRGQFAAKPAQWFLSCATTPIVVYKQQCTYFRLVFHICHHSITTYIFALSSSRYPLYVQGLSEKFERVCTTVGISSVFATARTSRLPEERKRGVVYQIHCNNCEHVYTGKSKRTRSHGRIQTGHTDE